MMNSKFAKATLCGSAFVVLLASTQTVFAGTDSATAAVPIKKKVVKSKTDQATCLSKKSKKIKNKANTSENSSLKLETTTKKGEVVAANFDMKARRALEMKERRNCK